MNKKTFLAVILLMLIPSMVLAQVAFRKEPKDKLVFEMSAGDTATDRINVVNMSDSAQDVLLYAADGTRSTTGSFAVRQKTEPAVNIGSWIKFDTASLHLEPKEEKKVGFMITIPADTPAGEYGGGLAVESANKTAELKQTGAVASTRVVTPVYITITGQKITNYSWEDFSHAAGKTHSFNLSFSNKGNVIIKTLGEINITSLTGKTYSVPLGDSTLYQNDSAAKNVAWTDSPFFGIFQAKATVEFYALNLHTNNFEKINEQEKTIGFNIIPLESIITVALIVLLTVAAFVWRKIAYDNYVKRCVKYTVAKGDTIRKISAARKIAWQKLAKINGIEAPYDLTEGSALLVPPLKQ